MGSAGGVDRRRPLGVLPISSPGSFRPVPLLKPSALSPFWASLNLVEAPAPNYAWASLTLNADFKVGAESAVEQTACRGDSERLSHACSIQGRQEGDMEAKGFILCGVHHKVSLCLLLALDSEDHSGFTQTSH